MTINKAIPAEKRSQGRQAWRNESKAFCVGFSGRSSKGHSNEHPCARRQSHDHGRMDCPHPPSSNEDLKYRDKGERQGREGERTWRFSTSSPSPLPVQQLSLFIASSRRSTQRARSLIRYSQLKRKSRLLPIPPSESWTLGHLGI